MKESGTVVNATCDLRFSLWDASADGSLVGATQTVSSVSVSNGLFAVSLDFGSGIFQGDARWLETAIRKPAGVGNFITMTSRQILAPSPYALYATTAATASTAASLAGTLSSTQLTGTVDDARLSPNVVLLTSSPSFTGTVSSARFTGDGAGMTGVNADQLDGQYRGFYQNASNLTVGTIADARLSSNVVLLTSSPSFTGTVAAAVFVGGQDQTIQQGAENCFIGGGMSNKIKNTYSDYSGIAAGLNNTIGEKYSSPYSFIGGGRSNVVDNDYGVIGGGRLNYIKRLYCFIGGGRENVINDDASVICGGKYNWINEYGEFCFIGGGYRNYIRSYNPYDKYNTIVGGYVNSISNSYNAVIGGGSWNLISYGPFSTISGGQRNISFEKGTTISGGRDNRVVGEYCTVSGGWSNRVDGYSYYSTIPGGKNNRIYASNYGFAAGRSARIWHNGCFAWADSNSSTVDTTTENQFIARASGGFVFMTATNGITAGAQLPAGSGSWSSLSDRNAKENVRILDNQIVLEKISTMPISTWNYKAQDDLIRHAGPMAQDFHAAFGLGEDKCHLSSIDVDGIALSAIKGLYEMLEETRNENAELRARIEELERRIEE